MGGDAVEFAKRRRHLWLLSQAQGGAQPLSRNDIKELEQLEKEFRADSLAPADIEKDQTSFAAEELLNTRAEAAAFVSVHFKTIGRWVAEGMPRTSDKKYIKSILLLYKERGKDKASTKAEADQADAELKKVKAKLARRKLEQHEADFHDAGECNKRKAVQVKFLQRRLLGLPRKLENKLAQTDKPKKVNQILKKELVRIITDFGRE